MMNPINSITYIDPLRICIIGPPLDGREHVRPGMLLRYASAHVAIALKYQFGRRDIKRKSRIPRMFCHRYLQINNGRAFQTFWQFYRYSTSSKC